MEDGNATLESEVAFVPTIGMHCANVISNNNGDSSTLPDGQTMNEIDHVLIDTRLDPASQMRGATKRSRLWHGLFYNLQV